MVSIATQAVLSSTSGLYSMVSLEQGLLAKITGDATLAAILGGPPAVFRSRAPQGTEFPFLVYTTLPALSRRFLGGDGRIEDVPVLLTCVSNSSFRCLQVQDRLATLFEQEPFAVASGALVQVIADREGAIALKGKDALGNDVYTTRLRLTFSALDVVS
jgi:hypothetical protein